MKIGNLVQRLQWNEYRWYMVISKTTPPTPYYKMKGMLSEISLLLRRKELARTLQRPICLPPPFPHFIRPRRFGQIAERSIKSWRHCVSSDYEMIHGRVTWVISWQGEEALILSVCRILTADLRIDVRVSTSPWRTVHCNFLKFSGRTVRSQDCSQKSWRKTGNVRIT